MQSLVDTLESAYPLSEGVRIATGAVIDVPCALVYDHVARLPRDRGADDAGVGNESADGSAPAGAARAGGLVVPRWVVADRWRVRWAEAPHRWCAESSSGRDWALLEYHVDATSTGCYVRETLVFRSPCPWLVLDAPLVRWWLERRSRYALARLKRRLEAHGPTANGTRASPQPGIRMPRSFSARARR